MVIHRKWQTFWPLALLTGAVLTLFWPVLLHPAHILYPTFSPFSDTMVIHWPKAHLMVQSWQATSELPLWTPLTLSGMPLAANQLAMLFYPPGWLLLIFPIEPIFNLLFIFHLVWGGGGIYFLLREVHKQSTLAALLGGLTFALNGKWLAHAAGGHVTMVGAIGWMPWVVLATMQLTRAPTLWMRLVWSLLAAIALTMQITTHSLPLIYSIYLVGAIVIWHLVFMTKNRLAAIKQLCFPLLLIPVLAGLLGAVQLLPLLELTRYSNRALSLSEATEYALSPAQLLIGLLLPSAGGGHEYVIYLGLIPLVLAPFGLKRQNRWAWFYAILLIFTILFALGPYTPVHGLFYYLAPGFRWVRTPARMFFVGGLATAALVGFAVGRLQYSPWSAPAARWLARLTVALGGLALMIGLGLIFGFAQTDRAAVALALVIPLGLGVILLRALRVLSAPVAITLLGLLLFLDLAWFDTSMMRFVAPDEALAPGRSTAHYLAQKTGPFRVYSPSYSLPAQTAAAAGLHLADGVEPVHLAVYDQYMARAGGYRDPSFSVTIPPFNNNDPATALQGIRPNLKLLGMLNVTHLASAFPMNWPGLILEQEVKGTFIYQNEVALPRAWVAYQSLPADTDWLAQLERQPNLMKVVIIDPATHRNRPTTTNREPSTVDIINTSANRIDLATELPAPGWLVLSEIWYPGWQATVNGESRPVEQVNGLLRGVYLAEPGTYQITVAYQPRSVMWGSWISGLTAGLIIGGTLLLSLLWVYKQRKSVAKAA